MSLLDKIGRIFSKEERLVVKEPMFGRPCGMMCFVCTCRDEPGSETFEQYKARTTMTEQQAAEGLDICGYAGKWKNAKETCAKHHVVGTCDYWANVRKNFLELGGCYLNQK